MGDRLIMNQKERRSKVIVEQVISGFMSKTDASKRLGVSARQFRRIFLKYKTDGDEGLIHKNRGKVSTRAITIEIKKKY